jgi:hypothetical protein
MEFERIRGSFVIGREKRSYLNSGACSPIQCLVWHPIIEVTGGGIGSIAKSRFWGWNWGSKSSFCVTTIQIYLSQTVFSQTHEAPYELVVIKEITQ